MPGIGWARETSFGRSRDRSRIVDLVDRARSKQSAEVALALRGLGHRELRIPAHHAVTMQPFKRENPERTIAAVIQPGDTHRAGQRRPVSVLHDGRICCAPLGIVDRSGGRIVEELALEQIHALDLIVRMKIVEGAMKGVRAGAQREVHIASRRPARTGIIGSRRHLELGHQVGGWRIGGVRAPHAGSTVHRELDTTAARAVDGDVGGDFDRWAESGMIRRRQIHDARHQPRERHRRPAR